MSTDDRKRDLQQIHIAKAQLDLDDDVYRDLLYTVTRKRSAKDMDSYERGLVLQSLIAKGFKPAPSKRKAPERAAKLPGEVRLIYALWGALGRKREIENSAPAALRAWIRHFGAEMDVGEGAPEMLAPQVRHRVAEFLIQWCQRLQIPVAAVDRLPGKRGKRRKSHR